MEVAIPTVLAGDFASQFLRGWLQAWVNACNHFRQWERKEVIKKRPSPETMAQHKKFVTIFIRSAHILQALMDDSDYPAREFLPEIQGKLLQLEDSREMIHNPISEEEADHILKEVFPDEPRAGSPA